MVSIFSITFPQSYTLCVFGSQSVPLSQSSLNTLWKPCTTAGLVMTTCRSLLTRLNTFPFGKSLTAQLPVGRRGGEGERKVYHHNIFLLLYSITVNLCSSELFCCRLSRTFGVKTQTNLLWSLCCGFHCCKDTCSTRELAINKIEPLFI